MENLLVFLCFLHVCCGAIYRLNDTEYERMPPKYAGDSWEKCFREEDGMFCCGEFELFSNTPSPLLDMIHEYSAHNTTHFNYTRIRRGLCITQTCKKFNVTVLGLRGATVACLNESIYNKYQLQARSGNIFYCNHKSEDLKIDTVDMVVALLVCLWLLLNLVGTVYEEFHGEKSNLVSRFFLCFSLRKNWRKLTAPVGEDQDPRMKRLKSIHSIRTITIALVIMAHSVLGCVAYIDNPDYLEKIYHLEVMKVVMNGMLVMQTFLVMSGFLLVYNSLLLAEKHQVSWGMLPKYILLRWLRLTPPYAVVLVLTLSWFRFLSGGPMWHEVVGNEVTDCRRFWWMNLFYINNYNDSSACMLHTWYLAADTQLYCFGVLVYLACRTPLSRKVALPILFIIGAIIPGIHTYIQNLDGALITSPEAIHAIFMNEPTFNNTYRRGHTNLAGYVIGLSIGFLIYHWQKKGFNTQRLRKYRYYYLLLVPLAVSVIYFCSIFTGDIPRPPLYVRVAVSILVKPIFAIIIALGIIIYVLKLEDLSRRAMEWSGWRVPSRVSYSAYLIHLVFLKHYVGVQTTITHTSFILMCQVYLGFLLASFFTAFPLWLLVEAPVGNLIKTFIMDKAKRKVQNENNEKNEKVEKVESENSTLGNTTIPKKELSDEQKIAIEKVISLNSLKEILCEGQQ